MEHTPNLQLPYIMPSQAQKHVTHNEALQLLDATTQLAVLDRHLTAPPSTGAQEGDRYIVASGATGPWAGWDQSVAHLADGVWRRMEPRPGWLAWIEDEQSVMCWSGNAWLSLEAAAGDHQNLPVLGVGTGADASNPFAAKLNGALWTARYEAEGGDGNLRYAMNKEASDDTVSLLLQKDWSGRAEIGLIGDDDLSLKLSTDGTAWQEAMRFDRASGVARFPATPALDALAPLTGENGAFPRYTANGSAVMQAIVGTVSQTSGVPTGALMETGSDANGHYARWANGWQICIATRTLSTVGGSGNIHLSGTWTFPVAFSAAPWVLHITNQGNLSDASPNHANRHNPTYAGATATNVTLALWSSGAAWQSGNFMTTNAIALGRWF